MPGGRKPGNSAPQLHDAAAVAAIANHLVDARGAQARMLIQSLANELQVGIDDRRTQLLAAMEAVGLNGVAHGIGVNAQFTGDGADFPMLGVKIAANLDARFWRNHRFRNPDRGIRGNGSTKQPLRPQMMQHNQPHRLLGEASSGLSALALGSHIRMVPEK